MIRTYSKQEYARAYTELIEILRHIPQDELNKIPKETIEKYIQNKDNEYEYKYNTQIPLEEQEISHLTQILIANIYIEYWATEEEKQIIKKEEQLYLQEQEEKKKELYSNNIFKTKQEQAKEETGLIIVEKVGLLEKIIQKLKKWLKLT